MAGLLDDRVVTYRGALLPYANVEFRNNPHTRTEWAMPGLLQDPLAGMNKFGGAVMGNNTISPDEITQLALDTAMLGSVGSVGSVPAGSLGAHVWQGGPHKYGPDGVKESLKHIGKGEGAQAYGWGRYDAGARDVAEIYKRDLAGGNVSAAKRAIESAGGDVNIALTEAKSKLDRLLSNDAGKQSDPRRWAAQVQIAEDKIAQLNTFKTSGKFDAGNLYKHDLPDEDIARYLDWDAPLSEHPESVRAAWEQFKSSELGRLADESLYGAISRGEGQFKNPTGKDLYQTFVEGAASKVGPANWADNADYKLAAEELARAGIPGLKYLDGMSRGRTAQATIDGLPVDQYRPQNGYEEYILSKFKAGKPMSEIEDIASMRPEGEALLKKWKPAVPEGTHNYVTWDQDVLNRMKLLERNGETFGANASPVPGLLGIPQNDDIPPEVARAWWARGGI